MSKLSVINQDILGDIISKNNENFSQVVSWRRHLHSNPELSFEEFETSQFIAEKLREFGYFVETNIGGTGLIARLKGEKEGKSIAFRADFDALPIQDLKKVPYASKKDGISHSCGHDGHAAALLGVAQTLKKYEHLIKGEIVFVFQHAEEKPPGGAKEMIAQNILKDVDYVFAAHLDSSLPVGKIAVGAGFKMAAVDYFNIQLKGRGGHGAKPHQANDALVAGGELVGSLQKIVSRSIDPLESAVVTIGQFHSGTAFNVIAENAFLEGTVRTYDGTIRNSVKERIEKITKGLALAHDIEWHIDYLFGYPALFNHVEETENVKRNFIDHFGEDKIVDIQPSMGAEDFAYFLKEKPGTYFKVGSHNENASTRFAHHHGCFDIDERALQVVQEAFIYIATKYIF